MVSVLIHPIDSEPLFHEIGDFASDPRRAHLDCATMPYVGSPLAGPLWASSRTSKLRPGAKPTQEVSVDCGHELPSRQRTRRGAIGFMRASEEAARPPPARLLTRPPVSAPHQLGCRFGRAVRGAQTRLRTTAFRAVGWGSAPRADINLTRNGSKSASHHRHPLPPTGRAAAWPVLVCAIRSRPVYGSRPSPGPV